MGTHIRSSRARPAAPSPTGDRVLAGCRIEDPEAHTPGAQEVSDMYLGHSVGHGISTRRVESDLSALGALAECDHQTLKVPPAMAAGVTDKLWEIGDIVAMV